MPLFTPRSTKATEETPTPNGTAAGDFQPDGSFSCALGRLSAEEVSLARINFSKFDSDGDGIISREDFDIAMAKHDASFSTDAKKAQLDSMYAAVDLDGSGRVSFDKFCVMRVRKKLTPAERAAAKAAGLPGAATPRGNLQVSVPSPGQGLSLIHI